MHDPNLTREALAELRHRGTDALDLHHVDADAVDSHASG